MTRTLLAIVASAGALGGLTGCGSSAARCREVQTGSAAGKALVNVDDRGVALQGYDPVAYFTDGKPVKGRPEVSAVYRGATYRFASAEHKAMFEANPAKYEPQFGGFCGYAASINRVSPISVDYWEILDGRLVLQHNQKAWNLWHQDVAGNLKRADGNWPGIEKRECR